MYHKNREQSKTDFLHYSGLLKECSRNKNGNGRQFFSTLPKSITTKTIKSARTTTF